MNIGRRMFSMLLASLFTMSVVSVFASDDKSGSTEPAVEYITVDELKTMMDRNEPVIVLDVRGRDYDEGKSKIKGAKRIAPGQLEAHLKDIARDKTVVAYCACLSDGGAIKTARTLLSNGFGKVRVLKGGWNAWIQSEGPVENK